MKELNIPLLINIIIIFFAYCSCFTDLMTQLISTGNV